MLGAAVAKVLGNDGIELGRGHARSYHLRDKLMRLPDTDAGLAHERNFAF